MIDVQNSPDTRGIPLQHVGVRDIRYPIKVLDKVNEFQHTIGSFNLYVHLTADFKGTHMSRFIEILNHYRHEIDINNLDQILEEMKKKLNSEAAHIDVTFPYFIKKSAPVSKAESLMEYRCKFCGTHKNDSKDFTVTVEVPVTTLCPCSKEISDRGAHNQRSLVKVNVRYKKFVWLEDVIRLVEDSASCELYPLLKRVDEKAVTEKAYDNPRFAEDVAREVALKLDDWSEISWYTVECENFESIHGHNAYAYLKKQKS
ncbi:MAG: GTP cyclohydrolase [Deltaproteobacteria bacterium GWA2_38_16]|nr:MAG: GTP cyclohydrolase [Deltaproteobacteria bacterium GWA2_38_16]OGQ03533.1 MAG: GTP cyclohydrolase [Deltaproteobacteria bacterium RIFCSPHIGHO2_02_FULL_38_15]OGQ34608.1 MAG: GTP cyclohydrolase [Deltaproteobacteria bacterium RIFCSPLOWO2_01_FULL_38_9]OGQ59494.1 MAG: GTP cyclohydrolase [Deltaproteobacteria bacterium RIFCSPLOWO2_12_FULL_38_8]HBQ21228.1 GTP cyclohydrolase I FolE2 [Deltaproteobacteria bacterium]